MIDQYSDLEPLLAHLRDASVIALDTEADSLHAYPEKLCLIQIGLPVGDFLVDPLSSLELSSLWSELQDKLLILHGSDYDLRLLRRQQQFVPRKMFDTMVAARLLGMMKFGLSDLVETVLQVKLEKGPQKADWARRPLTPRMEEYARYDVHYLIGIQERLRSELIKEGRIEWHEECCERLLADCTEVLPPDPNLIWRIKGAHVLDRRGLGVLREIWQWRDGAATKANRPPYFILPHESLIEISAAAAAQRPVDPLIPKNLRSNYREGVAEAVQRGLALPATSLPDYLLRVNRRPTEAEKSRFTKLQEKRDLRARQLGIDPTLIASKATLMACASEPTKAAAQMMRWQRALLEL